jgi:ABC-2 type transport system permease protein
MAGKMLGLSFLGLTQMAVWVLVAFLFSAAASMPIVVHDHVLLLVLYFILGYLLYASLFVAIGSPVTTEQEAQHVTGYLVMVLVIPLVLAVPAIQDPGAGWITLLSFFPLLTPTMMGLRIVLGAVAPGEILATVGLLLGSIVIALIVAGRIFRIAILSTGKSPSFREILSWVRLSR